MDINRNLRNQNGTDGIRKIEIGESGITVRENLFLKEMSR